MSRLDCVGIAMSLLSKKTTAPPSSTPTSPIPVQAGCQAGQNYRPFDANHEPYAQQCNLAVEHQFSENLYGGLAYVGNKGTRLLSQLNPLNAINPTYLSTGTKLYDQFQSGQTMLDGVPVPYTGWVEQMTGCAPSVAQALLPYPQYCGNIYGQNENVGNSTYHSLQAKLEKRFSKGIWMLASYTWSKTITDADSAQSASSFWSGNAGVISPFEQKRNKGLATDDVPHILAVSVTYQLPVGPGKAILNQGGVMGKLLGGWQATSIVRAASGQPLSFRSGFCNLPGQFAAVCIPRVLHGGGIWGPTKGSC